MSQPKRAAPTSEPREPVRFRHRVEELRALIPEIPAWPAGTDGVEEMAITLAGILERKQRHLIEENVRLAALREMTETLLRDPEEERVLRTISLYLCHAYSLAEVLVLSRDERGGLRGYRALPGAPSICEAIRWSAELLHGSVWDRALTGQIVRGEAAVPGLARTSTELPVILPLRAGHEGSAGEAGRREGGHDVMGLLALRASGKTGAGDDPLHVEHIAFQAATLLESVRSHQRTASERRFRECLLEAMEDGLIATDGQGRLTAANQAALSLLDADRESILGRPLETLEIVSPELVAHCRVGIERQMRVSQQEAAVHASAERIPISVSVVPLGDGGEEAGGIVATFSDLRPLRSMEQEMRRLDRLAALGRFASAVAHEIRNPLAAIGAGVEFLSGSIPPERQEDLRFVRAEVGRLDRIVCDLLEPARTRPLVRDRIAAGSLVRRACQVAEPQAREKGVELTIEGPRGGGGDEVAIDVDVDRMLQVLVNVIRNAIEASPTPGRVLLGWRREVRPEGPTTSISVEDQGAGIPREHLAHIFEPFYSTKPTGTGLGLFVSHGVVESHGGNMQVESPAAGGTRVTVLLPAAER